eukprot:snap_masked-scaffold_9-processed-gene-9.16-mRNA-1 protein AED:1.00 eAED:1.00 QI:0/-1/0/0/-1/1/1/0/151
MLKREISSPEEKFFPTPLSITALESSSSLRKFMQELSCIKLVAFKAFSCFSLLRLIEKIDSDSILTNTERFESKKSMPLSSATGTLAAHETTMSFSTAVENWKVFPLCIDFKKLLLVEANSLRMLYWKVLGYVGGKLAYVTPLTFVLVFLP